MVGIEIIERRGDLETVARKEKPGRKKRMCCDGVDLHSSSGLIQITHLNRTCHPFSKVIALLSMVISTSSFMRYVRFSFNMFEFLNILLSAGRTKNILIVH